MTASKLITRVIDPLEGEVWLGDRGVRIQCSSRDVIAIDLLRGDPDDGAARTPLHDAPAPILSAAMIQLGEYLLGERQTFELPLWISGGVFYRQVWEALRQVPYGKTVTYGELAAAAGNAGAVRAVGGAMSSNKLPLVVPCHRVVASGGKLGGFAYGTQWKQWLLEMEQRELIFE